MCRHEFATIPPSGLELAQITLGQNHPRVKRNLCVKCTDRQMYKVILIYPPPHEKICLRGGGGDKK